MAAGLLSEGDGEVDAEFFALSLNIATADVSAALEELAAIDLVRAETTWHCDECDRREQITRDSCSVCGHRRSQDSAEIRSFFRPAREASRDPAAIFLIHGMNTFGDWQQSLAWKVQLLYGRSLPVFVFKFGRDRTSPLTQWAQRARTRQLAEAIRSASGDLARAGRNTRCDVIAHSFGTLMLARLLEDADFKQFEFGRVILCGSIAPRETQWSKYVLAGRIESVLNHRAGRDLWVRLAPWIFPNCSASGVEGFEKENGMHDVLSPTFSHSDYFTQGNFDGVMRRRWTPFLNGRSLDERSGGDAATAREISPLGRLRGRYWIGRLILLLVGLILFPVALQVVSKLGHAAQWVLTRLGQ
jgi:hypothetical protein